MSKSSQILDCEFVEVRMVAGIQDKTLRSFVEDNFIGILISCKDELEVEKDFINPQSLLNAKYTSTYRAKT